MALLAPLSLGRIPFPRNRDFGSRDAVRIWAIEPEGKHLVLVGPFDRQVGKARNAHAMGQVQIAFDLAQVRLCLCNGVLEPSKPFRPLCLCLENSVSRQQRLWFEETRFECVELLSWKAEHAVLAGPFHRQVGEACNPHAVRESTRALSR
jgi:hypothetical protein